jgi:peptidoglycan/LPS O-acetylase OafA/YrhL
MISVRKSTRVFAIDIIRAVAIIGVMVTHSLAVFLGPPTNNFLWNYLHFVVVAFVFCSGYLTMHTYHHLQNGNTLLMWYKKRFFRLYIPFAVYTLAYIFTHRIHFLSRFVFDSFTLAGGIDVGWLTLLFIQLTALTPILIGITRNKMYFYSVLSICGLFSLITTFYRIPSSYSRGLAWFPWISIFLLGSYLAQKDHFIRIGARYFVLTGIVTLFLWLFFTAILNNINYPLTLTLHKYPPDLYYLLYGTGILSILLGLSKKWRNPDTLSTAIITFLSKNSYGMFFMHLIVLFVLTKTIPHADVLTVTSLSVGFTLVITKIWSSFSRLFFYSHSS